MTTYRKFGVELELSNNITKSEVFKIVSHATFREVEEVEWSPSYNNSYWHVKYDATCGIKGFLQDKGWEVASFVASSENELNEICQVADKLRRNGAQVNNNCGMHIHIGIQDFDRKQAGVLLAKWIKIEPYLIHILPDRRIDNNFCALLSKHIAIDFKTRYSPVTLWETLKPTQLYFHNNPQRRYSLNMVNYESYLQNQNSVIGNKRPTVELRLPEGTLDPNCIYNWVKIFLSFVETTKRAKMPSNLYSVEKIDDLFCILGLNNKHSMFAKKELTSMKKWLLNRIVFYSKDGIISKKALHKIV